MILIAGRALARLDPARLVSSFAGPGSGGWAAGEFPAACCSLALIGNAMALPLYSLVWRAGRVGGRATLGRPPTWSLSGLMGTLRFAAAEIWEPLQASLVWTAHRRHG